MSPGLFGVAESINPRLPFLLPETAPLERRKLGLRSIRSPAAGVNGIADNNWVHHSTYSTSKRHLLKLSKVRFQRETKSMKSLKSYV